MNNLVYVHNDVAVCDSLQVAEKFGKRHDNVLREISSLLKIEECNTTENLVVKEMFKVSTYKAGNGQIYKKYYMNRDGFSLLTMGFTGQNTQKSKEADIQKCYT